jgi:hypothetical protein
VIIKTFVAGRVVLFPLPAVPEKSEGGERYLNRFKAGNESAFNSHRVRGERKARGGDTGRPAALGFIRDQSIGRVGLLQEISERAFLDPLQQSLVIIAGLNQESSSLRKATQPVPKSSFD